MCSECRGWFDAPLTCTGCDFLAREVKLDLLVALHGSPSPRARRTTHIAYTAIAADDTATAAAASVVNVAADVAAIATTVATTFAIVSPPPPPTPPPPPPPSPAP